MYLMNDIITYVRRIIKSPSNAQITDSLIVDYINRFYLSDVDARIQLFDLKTKYQFQTSPGIDQYNMPMYQLQASTVAQGSLQPTISYYPVYQGFTSPVYINGIQVPFQTEKKYFFNTWPNIVQQINVAAIGNGTAGPYNFTIPIAPNNIMPTTTPFQYILRGHINTNGLIALANSTYGAYTDPPTVTNAQAIGLTGSIASTPVANVFPSVYITSNAADGSNISVSDSGQVLTGNQNLGLFMDPGTNPTGNRALAGGYTTTQNVINYYTGQVFNLFFPQAIPAGASINVQCYRFQCGLPRGILFYDNTLTFRSPPDKSYLVELDGYLTPAGFLASNQAIPFSYMSEYIARGAARKILSDTGDVEQFQFYEPLFREQEHLVWKRSQRQFTSTRTQTIYSQGINQGQSGYNNIGGSSI
jgi:hypothetical protein